MKKSALVALLLMVASCVSDKVLPLEQLYFYDEVAKIQFRIDRVKDNRILIHESPDSFNFRFDVLDNESNFMPKSLYQPTIYVNNEVLLDSIFRPVEEGKYKIYMKMGDIRSNEFDIDVYEIKKHISDIKLSTPYGNEFKADGKSIPPIITEVKNDLNLKIEDLRDLKLKDEQGNSFALENLKSANIKNFNLRASGYGHQSNQVQVKAVNGKVLYRVPVIFHILNFDMAPENIAYMLEAINAAFKNSTFDIKSFLSYTNIIHKNIFADDLNIEFYAATHKENGETLQYPGLNIINGPSKDYSTEDIPLVAPNWDSNRYFNIHFFKKNKQELDKEQGWWGGLGGGTLCYVSVSGEHITINKNYSYGLGIYLLAHEIGHCLSLPHTFNNGCFADPKIKNTYFYAHDGSTSGKAITGYNRVDCSKNMVIADNIMDYGGYSNTFTDGQIERMRNHYESSFSSMPSFFKYANRNKARFVNSKIYICE